MGKQKILKEIEKILKEKELNPLEKDKKKRKFYVKLYCPYYSEADGEYLNWDIEVEEFILNGKKYNPEAFEYFIRDIINEDFHPEMFYDLTSKHQEITEENMFQYLEYELNRFCSKYCQEK